MPRWIAGAGSTPIEAAGAVPSPRAASRWRRVPALLAALLGGAAAGGFLWRGITPTAAPPTVQRFTVSVAEAGLTLTNGGLAISPDGQTLVFAARGSDNDEYLYSRRLDDWRVKKIEGTKGASSPLFNPDGSWVAFLADGLLRKVPMGEGTPQTICELGYQGISRGSWSADDVIITGRWPQQPVRVSAAGGEAKALASTIPAGFYLWPHALPGGSLLLTLNSGAQPRVLALEAGGELRRLLDTPATCARYLPTGHLVYEAEGRLRAAPFDPERLKLVGDSRVVIDDIAITAHAGTAAIDYDVSATGTIAYMAASAAKFRLVWSDRAGRTEPLPLDVRQYAFPSLSRDGRQLTVTVTECTAANVWAGSVDAEPLMPLTSDGYARCSVFSPDGRWIYFGTNPGGAWFGLLRAPSDRSGLPERLLHDQGLQKPTSVSRTGTLLFTAALSNQENAPVRRHIMQMSVERPEAGGTPFGSPRGEEIEATFSPDGRWVAYQSNETGSWQVYVTPFPGPGPRQQVSLEGGMGPQWNPRGNGELFYQTQTALMSARVVGGAPSGRPTALFSWRKHEGYRREFDVAPDGERFLLMEPATPRTEIKLITNWFEELKEKVPVR